MLDIKTIRENPDQIRRASELKRIPCDVDEILRTDQEKRDLLFAIERLRAERNKGSKEVPKLQGEEKQKMVARMKELSDAVKSKEEQHKGLECQFEALMLTVPSVPAEDVPEGKSEEDNVELERYGDPPKFDFEPRDHIKLGELLDIIDVPRGVKLAGTRSYALKNEGALLEMAALRFATETLTQKGFSPMILPVLVKDECMIGTGQFPLHEQESYRVERDELSLIGTSEVTLMSYYAGEILPNERLPVYLAGISPCFRREAGSHGKDTKGLYRVHQFQKVEQVILCENDPEVSRQQHELLLGNSKEIVQALRLPFRVVAVCAGDLGQGQIRKHDIECWMPSRNSYGETHSCSTFHDFQCRRLNIRYRDEGNKLRFAHSLNNTAIASPRILISILENNQQRDGSVIIPKALRPYMNGQETIEPKG